MFNTGHDEHRHPTQEQLRFRESRGQRVSDFAVDGDCQRATDLAHTEIAESPETFSQHRHGYVLDRVEVRHRA